MLLRVMDNAEEEKDKFVFVKMSPISVALVAAKFKSSRAIMLVRFDDLYDLRK
jgi:hypothetical protein